MSGPGNEDEIDGVAGGADGSVFITGKFDTTTTIGTTTLRSEGAADIPLARIDAAGAVMWVRRFGGPGEDNFFDIDANATAVVATGIISGTVTFDDVTVTSAGGTDCVVVAFGYDGTVRWVTALGGPGDDGCNEVTVTADGSVVTSLDTTGDWNSPAGPLPALPTRDTLLMRLDPNGDVQWAARVGGDGPQRAKAIAVAPDGLIAFGGDTIGPLRSGSATLAMSGGQRSGWLSRWSADGELLWWNAWDGSGASQVKGVADHGTSLIAVGAFSGTVDVGGHTLDAGDNTDLAVVQYDTVGNMMWATSISADTNLAGAEIVGTSDGGVVLGGVTSPGIAFGQPDGTSAALEHPGDGSAWLARYCANGSVAWATIIAGTSNARPGELSLVGSTLFMDMALRGADNQPGGRTLPATKKDASLWAFDLANTTACNPKHGVQPEAMS